MLLYLPLRFCRLNRRPARGAQYFTGARILLGFGFLCLCLTVETALSSELYRYQDSKGQWVFGDRRSLGNNAEIKNKAEKVAVNQTKVTKESPQLLLAKPPNNIQQPYQSWRLTNPLPVTIQHLLRIKGQEQFFVTLMAQPHHELIWNSSLYPEITATTVIEHYYLLGEHIDKPDLFVIPPPYAKNKRFKISQGFNGTFSHSGHGNVYAIDIAMPIGEAVTAVKDGIVADGRDDFTLGGVAQYFLDKANHVTVLHDDGSYAIYAHILYGSMDVSIGERVQVGQTLARVGNTGFSTGPHVHFVMRYNSGQGVYSLPFKFKTQSGIKTPKEGGMYTH